jgi:hypothetical protein
MKQLVHIALVFLVATAVAHTQEKPTPASRPAVEQRAPGVALPDTISRTVIPEDAAKSAQGLPKFDLPEYVITGVAAIDLPDVSKLEAHEPIHKIDLVDPATVPRDRSTIDFVSEQKGLVPTISTPASSGRLFARSGTFLTSRVGLSLNQSGPDHFFVGQAEYSMSKAFVPYANRSDGNLDLFGGTIFRNPNEWYDRGTLSGRLEYGSETYRFYGSRTPSVTRTSSCFRLGVEYASPADLLFTYDTELGLLLNTITDSSSSATEMQFDYRLESNLIIGSVPINGGIDASISSLSGGTSTSLPFVAAALASENHWFGNFSVQGSVHFYLAQGMLGQKVTRVYPNLSVGYRIVPATTLSLAYLGRVQRNTLTGLGLTHPYLSSTSIVRQSDLPLDVIAAVETDWTASTRTRFSVRKQSVRDYPLFTDGSMRGIWTTDYRGTTNVITYEADLFAKFDANSYFALSAEINSSKNSVTQLGVPYLPDFRLRSGAWFEISSGFSVFPTLAYVDKRVPDLFVSSKMKEYLTIGVLAEYALLTSLHVMVDCQNLTNTRYEEWMGYRAVPLTVTAGLSYRW